MTDREPINGTVLPALPVPLPGVNPDPELLRGFVAPLEVAYAQAYTQGVRSMSERGTVRAEQLERECADHAAAAGRALAEEDFVAATVHAGRAAVAKGAAKEIRRTLNGNV